MLPEQIRSAVHPVFLRYGVPDYVWASIAAMETGGTFNPRLVGDAGASFGLFQLFTGGGQGDAWANKTELLLEPELNAEIAAPAIARAYADAKAQGVSDGPDLVAWVALRSGHPVESPEGLEPGAKTIADQAAGRVREYAALFVAGAPRVAGPVIRPSPGSEGPLTPGPGIVDLVPAAGAVQTSPGAPDSAPPTGITGFVNRLGQSIFSGDWWKRLGQMLILLLVAVLLIAAAVFSFTRSGGPTKEGEA